MRASTTTPKASVLHLRVMLVRTRVLAGYWVFVGVGLHPERATRQPLYVTLTGRGHGGNNHSSNNLQGDSRSTRSFARVRNTLLPGSPVTESNRRPSPCHACRLRPTVSGGSDTPGHLFHQCDRVTERPLPARGQGPWPLPYQAGRAQMPLPGHPFPLTPPEPAGQGPRRSGAAYPPRRAAQRWAALGAIRPAPASHTARPRNPQPVTPHQRPGRQHAVAPRRSRSPRDPEQPRGLDQVTHLRFAPVYRGL